MLFSCWRKNQPFGLPSRSRLVESSQRRWRLELENTRCVRQRWDWMFFFKKIVGFTYPPNHPYFDRVFPLFINFIHFGVFPIFGETPTCFFFGGCDVVCGGNKEMERMRISEGWYLPGSLTQLKLGVWVWPFGGMFGDVSFSMDDWWSSKGIPSKFR